MHSSYGLIKKQLIKSVQHWAKKHHVGAAKTAAILSAMYVQSDLKPNGIGHNWFSLAVPPKVHSVGLYLDAVQKQFPRFNSFMESKDQKSATQWAYMLDHQIFKKARNRIADRYANDLYAYVMMNK